MPNGLNQTCIVLMSKAINLRPSVKLYLFENQSFFYKKNVLTWIIQIKTFTSSKKLSQRKTSPFELLIFYFAKVSNNVTWPSNGGLKLGMWRCFQPSGEPRRFLLHKSNKFAKCSPRLSFLSYSLIWLRTLVLQSRGKSHLQKQGSRGYNVRYAIP